MKKTPPNDQFVLVLIKTLKAIQESLRALVYQNLKAGYSHSCIIPQASYSPWLDDVSFQEVYQQVKEKTLVDQYRLYELWVLMKQIKANGIPGDVLEVGTWKGGSGCLIAKQCALSTPDARVYLCDTFCGVVKTGGEDTLYKGAEHSDTSSGEVVGLAESLGLANLRLLSGIFPEDTGASIADRTFSLCHIDVDAHDSARDVFNWVWERLSVGGMVVFDDYGCWGCEGVTTFVNSIAQQPDRAFIYNANGHAILIRLSA